MMETYWTTLNNGRQATIHRKQLESALKRFEGADWLHVNESKDAVALSRHYNESTVFSFEPSKMDSHELIAFLANLYDNRNLSRPDPKIHQYCLLGGRDMVADTIMESQHLMQMEMSEDMVRMALPNRNQKSL